MAMRLGTARINSYNNTEQATDEPNDCGIPVELFFGGLGVLSLVIGAVNINGKDDYIDIIGIVVGALATCLALACLHNRLTVNRERNGVQVGIASAIAIPVDIDNIANPTNNGTMQNSATTQRNGFFRSNAEEIETPANPQDNLNP